MNLGIQQRNGRVGGRAIALLVLGCLLTLFMAPNLVSAVSSGGANVQGYSSNHPIDNGTIVQLTDADENRVSPAKQAEIQNMFGVTIDQQQMPVKLSQEGLENEVFVAVSGTYNVLVSTQGGAISSGDYVTLSSIDGIGMKAGYDEPTVFGRAVSSFDGQAGVMGQTMIKDVDGRDNQSVKLGLVAVTIKIERNPNEKSTKAKVPEALERIGQAIAEKEVDPIRIYLSMAITAVSLITAFIVIFSGVRSSIISIGRNPMTKKSIFRALVEIILTSFLILIIGLFAVYLLLKL